MSFPSQEHLNVIGAAIHVERSKSQAQAFHLSRLKLFLTFSAYDRSLGRPRTADTYCNFVSADIPKANEGSRGWRRQELPGA
jgi:hypothetical protein